MVIMSIFFPEFLDSVESEVCQKTLGVLLDSVGQGIQCMQYYVPSSDPTSSLEQQSPQIVVIVCCTNFCHSMEHSSSL
jgi:hypothetical protein